MMVNLLNKKIVFLATFIWIIFCVLLSVKLTLDLVGNPSPFSSSYWDTRWLFIFGSATAGIVLLFFLRLDRLLFWGSMIGIAIFLVIPIFTIGAGRPYLALVIMIALGFGIGDSLLRRFFGQIFLLPLERWGLSLLIGISFLMVLRSIQGALGLFKPMVTFSVLVLLYLGFVLPKLRLWTGKLLTIAKIVIENLRIGDLGAWPVLTAIFFLLFFPCWLIALSPPMRYDEMTYHLSGSLFYLQQGGIVRFPEGGANPWLHYAEMLYTLAIELGGISATRLLHFSMTLLSAIFIYFTAKQLVNRRGGVVSAFVFLAIPLVAYEGSTGYIDLFVTAYTTAFGYCLIRYWQNSNLQWLVLAGIFGGIGLGIKLSAGPMILAIVIGFGFFMIMNKQIHKIYPLFIMGGIILLFSVPWWIRDYTWRGDPFFPYGRDFIQKISSSQTAGSNIIQRPNPSTLERLFRYPVDIVLESRKYYHESPGAMTATLPFLALPIWALGSSLGKKEKNLLLLLIGSSFLAVGIMMIANNALLRYALPIFPWLAISAAANVETVFRYVDENSKLWLGTLFFALLMIFLFSTRPILTLRIAENVTQRLPINYFLGREKAEDYLKRNLPVYSAFQIIDAQPGGRHRVLSVGNEFRLYSQSRIDGVWDVAEAHELLISAKDESSLASELNKRGYDYILLNRLEMEYVAWKYTYPIFEQTDFLNTYCELIFADREVYVYRIYPQPISPVSGKNQIQNASFEETINGEIAGWSANGQAFYNENALNGKLALLLYGPFSNRPGLLRQRLEIYPDQIYTISYWSRALGENAVSVIRLYFFDSNNKLISKDEFWKNVKQEWHKRTFHFRSPQNAMYVEVEIGMGGYEGVVFDDFCFAKGQICDVGVGE